MTLTSNLFRGHGERDFELEAMELAYAYEDGAVPHPPTFVPRRSPGSA